MEITVIHAMPGRIRVRVPELKANPDLAATLQDRLASLPGLQQLQVNPIARSLRMHYDPAHEDTFLEALGRALPELDLSESSATRWAPSNNGATSDPRVAENIVAFFRALNSKVGEGAGGVDLKVLLPLVLAGLGVGDLVRRAILTRKLPVPNWYELFWFAFATFFVLNPDVGGPGQHAQEETPQPAAEPSWSAEPGG